MSKLPKLGQEVSCELEGYQGLTATIWLNAPQGIIEEWERKREEAVVRDERGRPVPLTDDKGEILIDPDTFEAIKQIDEAKVLEANTFFMRQMVLDFSYKEDAEGNPLSPSDADFIQRIPPELISWLYSAIGQALAERKEAGKSAVRLAGITGR